jgi:hypothetical protein
VPAAHRGHVVKRRVLDPSRDLGWQSETCQCPVCLTAIRLSEPVRADASGPPQRFAKAHFFFGQNVRTAFAVGQARGVALLAAGQRGTGCFSYTPQQIKGAVCGSGRAAKDQVARMVAALLALPQPPRPDHAADALAVAVCHAQQAPLAAAVERAAGRSPHPVAIEVVGAR